MPKTLLDGVNDVLKKVGFVAGDSGELTTLTDSARQIEIDICVANWNTAIEELFDLTSQPRANEYSTTDITLVASDRDYQLPNDLLLLRWPLIDRTNGYEIFEYPGGYEALVRDQKIPSNYTGRPQYGAVRPSDGELYFDRIPGSSDAGLVFEARYDADVSMSAATSTMPFSDAVYRAMVDVVAEEWRDERRNKKDKMKLRRRLAQAASYLTKGQKKDAWISLSKVPLSNTDPFNA